MKLTGTNSSIGLIVLIDHAHQRAERDDDACFVFTGAPRSSIAALQTARQTIGDGLASCTMPGSTSSKAAIQAKRPSRLVTRPVRSAGPTGPVRASGQNKPTCSKLKTNEAIASTSFSKCCASLTWWLSRGGCTRSHSEHGRETPQRQWYSVSRRGRVGRCQVCKTQHHIFSSSYGPKPTSKGSLKRPLFALNGPQEYRNSPGPSSPKPTSTRQRPSRTGKTKKPGNPGAQNITRGGAAR